MTNAQYNELTREEKQIILNKGTEAPFTGEYNNFKAKGVFVCRQCDYPLYFSTYKFDSGCGWPSFDDEIADAVKRLPDADGKRTEILCNKCNGHLGHVFLGEELTKKNTRHCVNSLSIKFIAEEKSKYEIAIFASGCFWGVQYHFQKMDGVISTKVGYIGGQKDKPTYKEVCTENTGHVEAIEVVFDKTKTTYEALCKLFFETHDPTQIDGQGPDIGTQYLSKIFYKNETQKIIAQKLIDILKRKGYKVITKIKKASTFWIAEEYHQKYYKKKNGTPYCHSYTKKF